MKVKQIIYAVAGILEWSTTLRIGGTRLRIQFSGGRLEGTGNMPATYNTKNPVVQKLIERSSEFKSGKIFRYFVSNAEEELTTLNERIGKKPKVQVPIAEGQEPIADAGSAVIRGDQTPEAVVEVGCSDDARLYLKEHHGVPGSRLPNRASIEEVGRSFGVEFRFQK